MTLSVSPQVTSQKLPGPPAKETWRPDSYPRTHVFPSSPEQRGQKQPRSLRTSSDPYGAGKPLPLSGLAGP